MSAIPKMTLSRWDSAEYLKTEEDYQAYLEACFEEAGNDAAFIAKALGTIARARGMTQLAHETGIGRESLYKSLSGEANPSFDTILKVIDALGLEFRPQIGRRIALGHAGISQPRPDKPISTGKRKIHADKSTPRKRKPKSAQKGINLKAKSAARSKSEKRALRA